jgi:hypothetical protein
MSRTRTPNNAALRLAWDIIDEHIDEVLAVPDNAADFVAHSFKRQYRSNGTIRPPVIGDVALCGWVATWGEAHLAHEDAVKCTACVDALAEWGWAKG